MIFKKPFRAEPVKLGPYYRHKEILRSLTSVPENPGGAVPVKAVAQDRRQETLRSLKSAAMFLLIAAVGGGCIGVGSAAVADGGAARFINSLRPIAVATGMARARSPHVGDDWRGCNEARAAGTAPIYFGEPGYRVEMDGDGDGVACEPYRGS